MNRRRGIEISVLAAVGALAGLQYGRVFGFGAVVVPAVGAAVGAAAVAALCGVRRQRHMVVDLVVSLAGMVVFAGVIAGARAGTPVPAPANLAIVADGIVNGWARILSTSLPVRADPALLVVVPVTTWVATWFGAELLRRTRTTAWPLVPPLLTFTFATFLGVGGAGNGAIVALAFAGSCLVLLAVRGAGLRADTVGGSSGTVDVAARRPSAARIGATVGGLAAVCGLVWLTLPGLAAMTPHPFDPREDRPLPLEDLTSLSPLSTLKAELKRPPEAVFDVTFAYPDGDGPPMGRSPMVRLTVLDTYDGTVWHGGGDYVVTGENVPDDEAPPSRSVQVDQDVTVRGLDSAWLPAVARPAQLFGADAVAADPATGVLAHRGTEAGFRYQVHSAAPVVNADAMVGASVDTSMPQYTQLPGEVPPELADLARQATAEVGDPFQKFAAIESYLRENFTYSLEAPTGHSFGQLAKKFLTQGGSGTPEQFAATFALMARSVGLPARVVVGYRTATPAEDGVVHVMSSDIWAWPEVPFAGLGWVAFEPTPLEGVPPTSEMLESEVQAPDAAPVTSAGGETPTPDTQGDAVAETAQPQATPWWVWALVVVGGCLVVAALVVAALAVARRRRTASRRDAADVRARVVGAWNEALDLVDIAYANGRDTSSMTAHEVAEFAVEHIGVEAARELVPLGRMADAALFDPRGPERSVAADAWSRVEDLESLLDEHTSGMRRLRLRLDPRRRRREGAASPMAP